MEGPSHVYKRQLEWIQFSMSDVDQMTQNLQSVRAKMLQFLTEKNLLLEAISQKDVQVDVLEAEALSRHNTNKELVQKLQMLETKIEQTDLELKRVVAEKEIIEGKLRKVEDDYEEHLNTMDVAIDQLGDLIRCEKGNQLESVQLPSVTPKEGTFKPNAPGLIVAGESSGKRLLFEEEDPSEEEDPVQRYVKDEPSGEPCPYRVVDGVIILDED